MDKRILKYFLVFAVFSFLLSGCYYFSAKKERANAEKLLSDLKGAGGEKVVPYEYTSAEKFLEISKMQFDEWDFKDSKEFAQRSKSASEAGLAEVKKKK